MKGWWLIVREWLITLVLLVVVVGLNVMLPFGVVLVVTFGGCAFFMVVSYRGMIGSLNDGTQVMLEALDALDRELTERIRNGDTLSAQEARRTEAVLETIDENAAWIEKQLRSGILRFTACETVRRNRLHVIAMSSRVRALLPRAM